MADKLQIEPEFKPGDFERLFKKAGGWLLSAIIVLGLLWLIEEALVRLVGLLF